MHSNEFVLCIDEHRVEFMLRERERVPFKLFISPRTILFCCYNYLFSRLLVSSSTIAVHHWSHQFKVQLVPDPIFHQNMSIIPMTGYSSTVVVVVVICTHCLTGSNIIALPPLSHSFSLSLFLLHLLRRLCLSLSISYAHSPQVLAFFGL